MTLSKTRKYIRTSASNGSFSFPLPSLFPAAASRQRHKVTIPQKAHRSAPFRSLRPHTKKGMLRGASLRNTGRILYPISTGRAFSATVSPTFTSMRTTVSLRNPKRCCSPSSSLRVQPHILTGLHLVAYRFTRMSITRPGSGAVTLLERAVAGVPDTAALRTASALSISTSEHFQPPYRAADEDAFHASGYLAGNAVFSIFIASSTTTSCPFGDDVAGLDFHLKHPAGSGAATTVPVISACRAGSALAAGSSARAPAGREASPTLLFLFHQKNLGHHREELQQEHLSFSFSARRTPPYSSSTGLAASCIWEVS